MSAEQCAVWLADLLVFQFATVFSAGILWAVMCGLVVWTMHGLAEWFWMSAPGVRARRFLRRKLREHRRQLPMWEEGT